MTSGIAVLGIVVFATACFLLPPAVSHIHQNAACSSTSDCSVTVVESIPENLTYPQGSPSHLSTYDAWMKLISGATKTIDIVAFYWTMRSSDTGHVEPSAQQGETVLKSLLAALKDRQIKIRIVYSYSKNVSYDITDLVNAGADVRSVDFNYLFNSGVLHTKMWIVDGIHLYVGSANMDWRSLTQVKELGAVVTNCSSLVDDASKLFEVYWYLGQPNTPIPDPWPSQYDTEYNVTSPMKVQLNGTDSLVFLSSSPLGLCPHGRTADIDAILHVINSAKKFIHIAVMDYLPSVIYSAKKSFWPLIDDALRTVSLEKGIRVRLLASKWNSTKPDMIRFLHSLADVNKAMNANIQVKLFIVPAFTEAQARIPFARVNHNKYMVTDNVAYIGTSNWSGDYFKTTAGVGLIINQTDALLHSGSAAYRQENNPCFRDVTSTVQHQLADIFERDWNSVYAHPLSDFQL